MHVCMYGHLEVFKLRWILIKTEICSPGVDDFWKSSSFAANRNEKVQQKGSKRNVTKKMFDHWIN